MSDDQAPEIPPKKVDSTQVWQSVEDSHRMAVGELTNKLVFLIKIK